MLKVGFAAIHFHKLKDCSGLKRGLEIVLPKRFEDIKRNPLKIQKVFLLIDVDNASVEGEGILNPFEVFYAVYNGNRQTSCRRSNWRGCRQTSRRWCHIWTPCFEGNQVKKPRKKANLTENVEEESVAYSNRKHEHKDAFYNNLFLPSSNVFCRNSSSLQSTMVESFQASTEPKNEVDNERETS